jgi:pyridoxamine 5'-phosphate oxidase family protein
VSTATAAFTRGQLDYLKSQRLGRLATVDANGRPHVVPVAFRHNPDTGTIDIGGLRMGQTKKFRDVAATGRAAFVVDDVRAPWRPRIVEVRGRAEALTGGGGNLHGDFAPELIRIWPERIVAFGIEEEEVPAGAS